MKRHILKLQKPPALRKGSRLGVVAPSSPGDAAAISAGVAELRGLGFQVEEPAQMEAYGYFAASHTERLEQFCRTVHDKRIDGVIAARGGYGANYLIDARLSTRLQGPKCMVGFSDFNIIQLLMLEVRGWAGFYGPMVATGLNHGAEPRFLEVLQPKFERVDSGGMRELVHERLARKVVGRGGECTV